MIASSPLVSRFLSFLLVAGVLAAFAADADGQRGKGPGGALSAVYEGFFVDWEWGLAQRKALEASGAKRAKLMKIARYPETRRYGAWDTNLAYKVSSYLDRAAAVDAIPLMSTYRLPHDGSRCGTADGGGSGDVAKYKNWIDALVKGIGRRKAVVFHEIDATITYPCLSAQGQKWTIEKMQYAARKLGALPNATVYIDGGAGTGTTTPDTAAAILRKFGVAEVRGFFTNGTHTNWTKDEIKYGKAISRRIGGKPFAINTATNGRGPLLRTGQDRVDNGNTVRCNSKGRGLGTPTTRKTADPLVDMYAWIGNPGRAANGKCTGKGGPGAGEWWEEYALELVENANF